MAQAKLLFFLIAIWVGNSFGAVDNAQCLGNAFGAPDTEGVFTTKERHRLLVFVSFSMNETSIASYMEQAHKLGAELFLVGIPGGNLRIFADRLGGLLKVDRVGMSIDEREFDRFDVKVVPTIVLAKEEVEATTNQTVVFDKVSGHVSIRSALELFAKEGDLHVEESAILAQ